MLRPTTILALLVAATLLFVPGCNILGPAYYFIKGPPKQPRQHTLDANRPTVIFIDDRLSVLPRRTLRTAIADRAETDLLRNKVLVNMIDNASIQAAAARDTGEQGSSIVRLGQSVEAEVIIYVWMDSFGLTPDGSTFQPFATARVKVIDTVAKESRVWPESFEGHLVGVTPRVRASEVPTTAAAQSKAQEELAAQLGTAIGYLFYDADTRESISDLRPGE
jgi:hypothetical protein